MKKLLTLSLLFFSVVLLAQDKLPFQELDVFQLEWVADPQVSPDGSQVVYRRMGMSIMKDRRVGNLWIINSDGSNHRKLTSYDGNESSARWSPDGKRIAYTRSTDQGSEIHMYWADNGKTARLTQLEKSPGSITWSPDGNQIAFNMTIAQRPPVLVKAPPKPSGAKWAKAPRITDRMRHERDGSGYISPGFRHIFVVPSEGGSPRQITSDNFNHGSPSWTPDGQTILFSGNRNEDWEYDYRNSEIYSVNVNSGEINALTTRNGPDGSPTVSPDGKLVAFLGYEDKVQTYQLTRLQLMNPDGSNKRALLDNLDRSISNPKWDAQSKGIYFQYDDKGTTKIGYVSLSGSFREVASGLGGTAMGRPYGGGSFTVSKNGVVAYNYTTPEHPAELAVVNKSFRKITSLNSDVLDYRELGQVEEIWYKSSFDQRDVQGWIVKPPKFDASKKYPIIIENHGGPISNYGPRFSPEIQLYSAAGYVVFYPNPRGSTSYGEEFGNLLYHNYPGNDYDDVMSGMDAVIAKGYIDEENLFVTGGSAGGIMSAWMIGKSDRFKAAAVVKPVMNWYSKTLVADNWYGYYNNRFPGLPWTNQDDYMKFSPISLVGNIECPTMVMVGMEDLRTPTSEAKQLYHALKYRKIPTVLVEIPGSYHFISNRPSQLITKIAHVVAWFDKYGK